MREFTNEERRHRLARRHHLATPATDVETVASALVGMHSSDPVTVYLSAWARRSAFEVTELEKALYETRTLLRILGMRRTMFVVPPDLAAVMDAACTRALAPTERQRLIKLIETQGLTKNGGSWLADVESRTLAVLDAWGEATATELTTKIPELALQIKFGEGKRWEGKVGISTRLLFLLAAEARIVRGRPLGTWRSSQYRWAPTIAWLGGALPAIPPPVARAELARRWLQSYGPGTLNDLKWWSGWTVRQTKEALADAEAVEVGLEEGNGFVLADDLEADPKESWVALLPGLDSSIMGWKERGWFLGPHGPALFDTNGNAGPTVWWNGRVVGGWAQAAGGDIEVRLLEHIPKTAAQRIGKKAQSLATWLDGVRIISRFRSPLEKELAP